MKRTISLILCAILLLAALAGCAEKAPASSGTLSPAASAQTTKPAETQSAKGLDQPDKAVAVPVNGFAQALYYDGGVYYINSNSDLCRLEDGETTGVVLAKPGSCGGGENRLYAITENGYAYMSNGQNASGSSRSVAVDLYSGEVAELSYYGASGETKPLSLRCVWKDWMYYTKKFNDDGTLYRRPLGGGASQEEVVLTLSSQDVRFFLCGDELFYAHDGFIWSLDLASTSEAVALYKSSTSGYGPTIYADKDYVFSYSSGGYTVDGRDFLIYSRADAVRTRNAYRGFSEFCYDCANQRIYGYENGSLIYFTPESFAENTYYAPDNTWNHPTDDFVADITLAGDWFYCMFYYDGVEGMNYRISLDGTQGLGLVAVSPDDPAFDARTELDMDEAWEAGLVRPEDMQAEYDATNPDARTGIMGGWIDEDAGLVFDFYSEHGVMVYAMEDNDSWTDDGRAFFEELYGMGSDVGYDRALDYIAYNLTYNFESGYLNIDRAYGSGEIFSYIVQVQDDASLKGETASGDSFTLRRLTDNELNSAKDDFFDKLEELLG